MIEQVDSLEEILEPYAGQIVYNSSEGKIYRWDPIEGWEIIYSDGNSIISMTAYDLNKQIIGQLEILDSETLKEKKQLIREFIKETKNRYYMLLCREINYFTLFSLDNFENCTEKLEDILVDECMRALGDLKAIDRTEDGHAIEIWYTAHDDTYVLYFFPYDEGVVLCV